jgi:dienelactone hydrolase
MIEVGKSIFGLVRPKAWRCVASVFLAVVVSGASAQEIAYDPLSLAAAGKTQRVDLAVRDADRNREIPLRVYLPATTVSAPVVLYSHGLGGNREGNPYLGEHWSARGFVVVVMQHHGSDDGVWKSAQPERRMAALARAGSLQNALLRFKDVKVVIDQLERWQVAGDSAESSLLVGRMDLARIGMSGHSFGAVTTQAVSGQRTSTGDTPFTDLRIKAALAMSPNAPKRGDSKRVFGGVKIPWMLMTGTHDTAPIGDATVASRLAVFPALPPGGKYELVLNGAEHNVFGDRALPGELRPRNPNHHRVVLALSTAFWDAWLRGDHAAQAWLDGKGPASVFEPEDRWQIKSTLPIILRPTRNPAADKM